MGTRWRLVALSTLAVVGGSACVSSTGATRATVAGPTADGATEAQPATSGAWRRPARPPAQHEIVTAVTGTRARIQSCYQRAVRRDSSLAGRMTVSATIRPTGAVGKVKVNATRPLGRALEPCVRDQVTRTPFPPSPRGYGMQFSFRFNGV